jgi:hypothetical protein
MRKIAPWLVVAICTVDAHAAQSLEGRWSGRANVPGTGLPMVVDLARDASGAWAGSLTLPGLEVKGAPLANIVVDGDEVRFESPEALAGRPPVPARFAARAEANGVLSGELVQAGNSASFTLRRVGPAQVDLPRRSAPVPRALEGRWIGTYELGGYPRSVTVDIANEGVAMPKVDFVIAGKATTKLPIDFVAEQEGTLRIESKTYGITFEGRVREGRIDGSLEQGPYELPLTLRRPS